MVYTHSFFFILQFAADFVEKHLFKNLLQKLQNALKKKKTKKDNLTEEFIQLITSEILNVDVELLLKVKASRNVAGKYKFYIISTRK